MQGGLASRSSTVSLTAYVLTALLEAGVPINTPIVMDAGRCVLADSSNDPYALALKAYALALAKDPNAQRVIQDLMSLAVVENNALYWNLPQGPRESCRPFLYIYSFFSPFLKISNHKIQKWNSGNKYIAN